MCACASDRQGRKGIGFEVRGILGPRSGLGPFLGPRSGGVWGPEVQAGGAAGGKGGGDRPRAVRSVGEGPNVVPANVHLPILQCCQRAI